MTLSAEPMREFDFGGALLQVFRTIGRNILMLLALNLVVSLLVGVIEIAVLVAAGGFAAFRPGGGGIVTAIALLTWVLCFGFQFAFLQAAVSDAGAGDPESRPSFAVAFSRGFRAGFANAGPIGAIVFIRGIAVFFASLCFLLPGMFLSVIWTVAVPAQVMEKTGVFGAFTRSFQLTQGYWLIVFGFNLVAGLIVGAAFYVGLIFVVLFAGGVGLAAGFGGGAQASTPAAILILLVTGVLYFVLLTLFFAATAAIPAAIYRELRNLKDGSASSLSAVFA